MEVIHSVSKFYFYYGMCNNLKESRNQININEIKFWVCFSNREKPFILPVRGVILSHKRISGRAVDSAEIIENFHRRRRLAISAR